MLFETLILTVLVKKVRGSRPLCQKLLEISVCIGRKARICTDNELGHAKFFHELLFKRDKGLLFVFIPRVDAEGEGNAVAVHEKPHLHDRQGAALLADPELLVVFGLFDFKIKVRAVIINDLNDFSSALSGDHAVPEQAGLYIVGLCGQHGEGPVDLVQLKIRLFNKAFRVLIGTQLGRGVKDPCVDQAGKYGIQIIAEPMPCADHGADPVQSEFVIDLLKEEVAAVEAAPGIRRQVGTGMQGDFERRFFLLFFIIHYPHLFPGPGFSVSNSISFTNKVVGTESFDNKGTVFPIHPDCLQGTVCSGVFVLRPSQSHSYHLRYIIQYL